MAGADPLLIAPGSKRKLRLGKWSFVWDANECLAVRHLTSQIHHCVPHAESLPTPPLLCLHRDYRANANGASTEYYCDN